MLSGDYANSASKQHLPACPPIKTLTACAQRRGRDPRAVGKKAIDCVVASQFVKITLLRGSGKSLNPARKS